ncbi:MAG: hypothetical protein PHU04_00260 [Candidatus Peribacteraceae bacterium]|nr:hypothetical protein [Candidatus Peribacteraceae bacterium]
MALSNILAAISAQADEQISQERSLHQKRISLMREESERRIAKRKQEIAGQKEERRKQLHMKAVSHSTMTRRNAELKKKQELLDTLYALVLQKLAALPSQEKEVETLLKKHLQTIKGNGEIRPSKAHETILRHIAPSERFAFGKPIESVGGFLFVSEREEHDCTFEHLVASYLRPQTEVEAAKALFSPNS